MIVSAQAPAESELRLSALLGGGRSLNIHLNLNVCLWPTASMDPGKSCMRVVPPRRIQ